MSDCQANRTNTDSPWTEPRPGRAIADVAVQRFESLKRIVAGMGFKVSEAEDVLQDVFLEALQRPGQCRGAESAFHWLVRVTINRCLLEHRSRKRRYKATEAVRQSRSQTSEDIKSAPDAVARRTEQLNLIRTSLNGMNESFRMLLVLRYFCGLNATQISDILELRPGTVRSRLRDARMILAKSLKQKGIEP